MQFRHGDVMLEKVAELPQSKRKLPRAVLAHGEITGHSHQIREQSAATLYVTPEGLFLHVVDQPATLIHEEHADISLEQGFYRVWRQREYSPEEIRIIQD